MNIEKHIYTYRHKETQKCHVPIQNAHECKVMTITEEFLKVSGPFIETSCVF